MSDQLNHNNPWANKLQQVSLPPAADGWNAMEVLLEKELPLSRKSGKRRWILLVLILLLLIGVCNCPGGLRVGSVNKQGKARINLGDSGNGPDSTRTQVPVAHGHSHAAGSTNEQQEDDTTAASGNSTKPTVDGNKHAQQNFLAGTVQRDIYAAHNSPVLLPAQKITSKNEAEVRDKADKKASLAVTVAKKGGVKNDRNMQSFIIKQVAGTTATRKRSEKNSPIAARRRPNPIISNESIAESTAPDSAASHLPVITTGNNNSMGEGNKKEITDTVHQPVDSFKTSKRVFKKAVPAKDSSAIVGKPKKDKDSSNEKGWAVAIGINQFFPVGEQEKNSFNSSGTSGTWGDYIPVPQLRYHFNAKLYTQLEVQFNVPQYTKSLLARQIMGDTLMGARPQSLVTIKKLYYFNVPVSVHYSPVKNLYAGAGIQFSRLSNGVALYQEKEVRAGADSVKSAKTQSFKTDSLYQRLQTTEWRYLVDVNYHWKNCMLGVRYNRAFGNFINLRVSSTTVTQAKNSSLQLYLRYTFWYSRKKKNQRLNNASR